MYYSINFFCHFLGLNKVYLKNEILVIKLNFRFSSSSEAVKKKHMYRLNFFLVIQENNCKRFFEIVVFSDFIYKICMCFVH